MGPKHPKLTAKELDEALNSAAKVFTTALKLEAQKIEPADKARREMVYKLMEQILALRDQGYAIHQITSLLIQSGLNITPDHLRTYIEEHILSRRVAECASYKTYLLAIAEKYESLGDNEFAKQIREKVEAWPELPEHGVAYAATPNKG